MFGALLAADDTPPGVAADVAREFSPRIEVWSHVEVVLDLSGLTRLFGDARTIAEELRRTAADRGVRVRVAIADTRTAARLLVRHRAGLTIVEPGTEAAAVAPLPLALLESLGHEPGPSAATQGVLTIRSVQGRHEHRRVVSSVQGEERAQGKKSPARISPHLRVSAVRHRQPDVDELLATLRRWGLRTLGDLVSLPADELAARLGRQGVALQQLSRGEDPCPLVPAVPDERFEQSLDLEWPIEDLEPLSFVLGRLMEPLAAHLEQRDRGAAVLHVRLHLVRTSDGTTRDVHERSLQLPFPIRDARTLRTLALLDLESHPPAAAIDRVIVAVDPTPARIVQFSLLARPLPPPEQISTLMARLQALMGETRCGSPATVDSWEPGAFVMKPFAPQDSDLIHRRNEPRRRGDAESHLLHSSLVLRPSADERGKKGLVASAPPPIDFAQDALSLGRRARFVAAHDATKPPVVALRRLRHPLPVRVRVTDGRPSSVVATERGVSGGRVESCAGPWRTSGHWWESGIRDQGSGITSTRTENVRTGNLPIPDSRSPLPPLGTWDRDEWDVLLTSGPTYRLFCERHTGRWFVEGVVD